MEALPLEGLNPFTKANKTNKCKFRNGFNKNVLNGNSSYSKFLYILITLNILVLKNL